MAWLSRAVVCGFVLDTASFLAEDLILEVGTSDFSASGVRIVASRQLRVGQEVCVRMGGSAGLAVSAQGHVVRCRPMNSESRSKKCNWGIAFLADDVRVLRQHHVFELLKKQPAFSTTSAILVSAHPLELLWWFSGLSKDVRTVLVGTANTSVIKEMQRMNPTRTVTMWDS
ncbi:MAG: PilZ domain-containing protein [Kofleriaceae bacterium]|nr:PilZ domain-containing protein [Kofleriaceae bacterium]